MRSAFLAEDTELVIRKAASDNHPMEIGGLLLGVYSADRPWITHALVIPPATRSPSEYVLPPWVSHPLIECARRIDGRLGYLGEWHVHPTDVGPSPQDRMTMARLASTARQPVMLILVRRDAENYKIEAHMWTGRRSHPLSLVRTGPLWKQDNSSLAIANVDRDP